MLLSRAEFLSGTAAALLGILGSDARAAGRRRPRMGIGAHSYNFRRFDGPLAFLDHCLSLGAGGVQTGLGIRDGAAADQVRAKVEENKLFLEGSIGLPKNRTDLERFEAEVRTAKRCGASLFRTVFLGGRRYEVFETAQAYRDFLDQSRQSLAWARPVVEKHEVRMAIENHKDLEAPELADLVRRLDCPWIGVCVDVGNNVALLEEPEETVRCLAPLALSTHIKDMGVEEYPDGFLLSEVPLGTGFLDLPKILGVLRGARPDIRMNLEMMTRDPLKIPCLLPRYWATMESASGRKLADMLRLVRQKASRLPLPRVSPLEREEQMKREEENVRLCLKYSREHLED
jgi:sugar phosphate isomerase/epimerase